MAGGWVGCFVASMALHAFMAIPLNVYAIRATYPTTMGHILFMSHLWQLFQEPALTINPSAMYGITAIEPLMAISPCAIMALHFYAICGISFICHLWPLWYYTYLPIMALHLYAICGIQHIYLCCSHSCGHPSSVLHCCSHGPSMDHC